MKRFAAVLMGALLSVGAAGFGADGCAGCEAGAGDAGSGGAAGGEVQGRMRTGF